VIVEGRSGKKIREWQEREAKVREGKSWKEGS
jgi:hypothetical protein